MTNNISDFPKKQTRTRRKTNYKNAENKKVSGFAPRTDNQKALWDAMRERSPPPTHQTSTPLKRLIRSLLHDHTLR